MIYGPPQLNEPLSQGDILDQCLIYGHEAKGDVLDIDAAPAKWSERVIVLSQACDLAQLRTSKILVALVHDADRLVAEGVLRKETIRDQVRQGRVFGWYFLPAAPAPIAFAESIVDLRDLHTVPRALLERLIADGKRVCRLLPPYREHLAQHFAVTYMRIGLPIPYETNP